MNDLPDDPPREKIRDAEISDAQTSDAEKREPRSGFPLDNLPVAADLYGYRLLILSLAAAAATFLIASCYPGRQTADETMELSFAATYGWIAAQSFSLVVPGLLAGSLVIRWLPRTGAMIGAVIVFAVPAIVFCDVLTFAWIGERFLSGTMKRVTTTLLPALTLHITRSTVIDAVVALTVAMLGVVVSWRIAGVIARAWARSRDPVRPATTSIVLVLVAALMSLPAMIHLSRTISEMRAQSVRHPFCAFHLVGYRGVGVEVPEGERAILARLRGLQSAPAVQRIDRRQLGAALDKDAFDASKNQQQRQDVIIIVAESMRPEIIHPDVMPNLYAFAQKSILCNRHFSAGNSTSFGVFALVNGLEAIWWDRPISERPILNRVFREAGYEVAFHGGEDDWEEFGMDGYIRAVHYDYFKIEYPELLRTDLLSVERTADYIEVGKSLRKRQPEFVMPRLAITYLLNTHCRYISAEEDQVFQPAAPENFLLPYSEATRPSIYNRYKNSARTLDRMIQPLLRDDCVVIFMGDHGESFLEDGSAIHGLRLSKVQNMTPLILYYPGVEPRTINQPTVHTDILPTLLSLLKIPVTDPGVFDGVDLTTVEESELENRIFTTTNMMDRSTGLIGPWTSDPKEPFAYRFVYKIGDWQIDYLNPIDDQGYEREESASNVGGEKLVRDWIRQRVGPEAIREDRSEKELFTEFLGSDDRETRISALRIAADIASPEPYLYDLIARAARDPDPEIRELAKEMVIRTERYSSRK